MVSLVWLSNVGFSINALTKIHKFFDLGKFDCRRLVFLRNGRDEVLCNLVCNVVDVRATLDGRYRVD